MADARPGGARVLTAERSNFFGIANCVFLERIPDAFCRRRGDVYLLFYTPQTVYFRNDPAPPTSSCRQPAPPQGPSSPSWA